MVDQYTVFCIVFARLSAHEEQNKIDKLELSVSSLSYSPRVRAQVVAVREDVNDAGIVL